MLGCRKSYLSTGFVSSLSMNCHDFLEEKEEKMTRIIWEEGVSEELQVLSHFCINASIAQVVKARSKKDWLPRCIFQSLSLLLYPGAICSLGRRARVL